jgi:hypothetical protein
MNQALYAHMNNKRKRKKNKKRTAELAKKKVYIVKTNLLCRILIFYTMCCRSGVLDKECKDPASLFSSGTNSPVTLEKALKLFQRYSCKTIVITLIRLNKIIFKFKLKFT